MVSDDREVMRLWRQAGLPEYFLGNGGTNDRLVEFAKLIQQATVRKCAEICEQRATTRCHEHGSQDQGTGEWNLHSALAALNEEDDDCAAAIRSAFESKG